MGVYIFGAGGHAKVVLDAFRSKQIEVTALIDPARAGDKLFDVPILGSHSEVQADGKRSFAVAIGDNQRRKSIFEEISQQGWQPISIVHASAVISPHAKIGEGTFVSAGAIINADAVIGANVIVNTGAVIEHDCVVGSHAHVAPQSVMGGASSIGEGTLFGLGSAMLPGKKVGGWVLVGAGSVIIRDVGDAVTVVGNPANTI